MWGGREPSYVWYALPTATDAINIHLYFLPRGPNCKNTNFSNMEKGGEGRGAGEDNQLDWGDKSMKNTSSVPRELVCFSSRAVA